MTFTLAAAVAAASGCTANIGGGNDNGANASGNAGSGQSGAAAGGTTGVGGGGGGTSTAPLTGPGRVLPHRLNIVEYNNTVRDLLGTTEKLPSDFPSDFTAFGFDNIASALTLTDVVLSQFFDAAKRIANDALKNHRSMVLGCDLVAGKEACVQTALEAFLPRAWRRPLEAGDLEPLVAVYSAVKADGNTEDEAFARVLQSVLTAPEFLYRVERNSGVAGVRDLSDYEVASRLSYFLWSSMPDSELTAAAAAGSLKDTAALTAQLKRMLASEKANELVQNFGSQWLPVRELGSVTPPAGFDAALGEAMTAQTMRLFIDVGKGTRPLSELFNSTSGYVNDRLAQHYGMTAVGSTTPVFTQLPADRVGLLTQGTFLTAVPYTVRRGKWILANVLCQEPPQPPFAPPSLPEVPKGATKKDQLAAHQTEPICAACHTLMDPLGLALEQYDEIGAFRTEWNDAPIDPSGVLKVAEGDKPFAGPAELGQIIATSPNLSSCVTKHVFAYGVGRGPRSGSDFDDFIVERVGKAFQDSGQLFPQLIEAMVTSDVFRKREDEANAP